MTAAADAQTLTSTPDDVGALSSVSQMYASVQQIAASAQVSTAQSGPGSNLGFLTAEQAQFAGDCVSQSGNTATYTDCEVEAATLSGTVTGDGTTADIDLVVMIDPAAYNGAMPADSPGASVTLEGVSVHEYGTLSYTSGIQGTMTFDIDVTVTVDMSGAPGMGNVPGMDEPITQTQTQSVTADFDVELTDGCATGGTLTVTGASVAGGASSTTVVTYGPACGQATAEQQ